MGLDEELAKEIVKVHKFMNEQYKSFRTLWISFDLFSVSIGLWLFMIALVEFFISLSTFGFQLTKATQRWTLMLCVRLCLPVIAFTWFQASITDL